MQSPESIYFPVSICCGRRRETSSRTPQSSSSLSFLCILEAAKLGNLAQQKGSSGDGRAISYWHYVANGTGQCTAVLDTDGLRFAMVLQATGTGGVQRDCDTRGKLY